MHIYRPRNPRGSAYYRCVEDHFERFEQVYEERFERQYGFFRPYVRKVIYRYLDCGILHTLPKNILIVASLTKRISISQNLTDKKCQVS